MFGALKAAVDVALHRLAKQRGHDASCDEEPDRNDEHEDHSHDECANHLPMMPRDQLAGKPSASPDHVRSGRPIPGPGLDLDEGVQGEFGHCHRRARRPVVTEVFGPDLVHDRVVAHVPQKYGGLDHLVEA